MYFPKYGDCKLINLGHAMLFLSATAKTKIHLIFINGKYFTFMLAVSDQKYWQAI